MKAQLRKTLLCLLALVALTAGAGAQSLSGGTLEPIVQQGGRLAGPDLSPYSRDPQKGEIVGRPPASRVSPTAPTVAPPVTPPGGPPAAPPANPPVAPPDSPVSVAAPPPDVPARQVNGFQPIQALFDNGSLVPTWTGQGRVAGEMLELNLENTTNGPIAITLEPGMVLELEDPTLAKEFQPVMLESDNTLLVPARSTLTRMLRGYCLDYSLLPPAANRAFPYRFPADTLAYAPAIDVLKASLTYDAQENVLPVDRQRTVVIQRSIWAALGQTDKEKLYQDILADAAAEGKTISKKKARRLADVIWSEVQRLLSQAQ